MIEKIRLNDESSIPYITPMEQSTLVKHSDLEKAIHPPLFTPTSSQYTQTELTCSKMKASFLSDIPLSPESPPKRSSEKHEYYDEQLNDSRNRRPHYHSVDDESHQDDSIYPRQPRLQQSVRKIEMSLDIIINNGNHFLILECLWSRSTFF